MKTIKKNLSKILLLSMFTVGLSLLLYPTVANWWNQFHSTQMISSYDDEVSRIAEEDYSQYIEEANAYNQNLLDDSGRFLSESENLESYYSTLSLTDKGMIGSLEIPSIKVNLPIYHGTSDEVLGIGLGHLENTSFPIGDVPQHSVISGHRGLPSARLLTDLDKLTEGDYFMVRVLDETYTYMVDQIRIVEPSDLSQLQLEEDGNYLTLVTCTPYGINTHRLLVRGKRVENLPDEYISIRTEAGVIDRNLISLFLAVIAIVVLILLLFIRRKPLRKE